MPPDAESLERWTHRSDWTIAAHGCNSVVDDVIRNAVANPATGPGGRLETVALEIRVPLRDDNPPRSGVNHVVVQAHNEVTNRRSAAHVLPCVGGSPGDIGGIELGKVTTTVRRRPHERSARSPSRLDQLRSHQLIMRAHLNVSLVLLTQRTDGVWQARIDRACTFRKPTAL
jgi:hypothetical protein